MKHLYFVRHAKSSWADMSMSDHERPLNSRGKRDAPVMAQKFLSQISALDIIISSDAKRAKRTAKHFLKALSELNPVFLLENSLYHASVDNIWNVVFSMDDAHDSALFFGHNPGFTEFANQFATTDYIPNVPTCGIYCLQSEASSWSEVDTSNTSRVWFIYPKMYPELS